MKAISRFGTLTSILLISALAFLSIAAGPSAPLRAWTLVWSDEFDGAANTAPNPANWGYEIGYIRNNEQQYYTNRTENARLDGAGNLIIEARRESFNGFAYTSASLNSQNKQSFQYGRFEMRGKIPTALGSWPAWWWLGNNVGSPPAYSGWPHSGEIDMMEFYRGMNLYNVMYQNSGGSAVWDSISETAPAGFKDSFHIWAMEWDATTIKLYLDGTLKNSFNVSSATVGSYNPFKNPAFLLMNLAIGGNNGGDPSGTTFPLQYLIDYVRVYTGSAPTPTPGGNRVQNPGFETGTLSPWTTWNNSVVTSNAHSGTHSMRVGTAAGSGEQTITGLSPNTTYTLTGWAKTSATSVQARIGVKNFGGTETYQTTSSTSYTQRTVVFTTGASNTSAIIYCYKPTTTGYIYCDDFTLTP